MGFIQFNKKLVSRPKIVLIPLNSFETKAVGFCKRATDVVVVRFFNKFFPARESNDRQTFKWMNSIKFIVSLLAKHWTYQTLNECMNAVAWNNCSVFMFISVKCHTPHRSNTCASWELFLTSTLRENHEGGHMAQSDGGRKYSWISG